MPDAPNSASASTAFPRSRRGFTLIELLVVIAIIAMLVALLLPAVQQAREAARAVETKNRLKQIGIGLHNYHETNNTFPVDSYFGWPNAAGTDSATWMLMIMPYIDQTAIYNQWQFGGNVGKSTTPFDGPNASLMAKVVPTFLAASTPRPPNFTVTVGTVTGTVSRTDFAPVSTPMIPTLGPANGFKSADAGFIWSRYWWGDANVTTSADNRGVRIADVTDGLTNTYGVIEVAGAPKREARAYPASAAATMATPQRAFDGHWSGRMRAGFTEEWASRDGMGNCTINCSNQVDTGAGPYSYHTGGAHALRGDGGVDFLSESMDQVTYLRMILRNDRQPVNGAP